MAVYKCPKCKRYGMEWDGRAKVLMCYYNTCSHVIRIQNQKSIPVPERISEAIDKDRNQIEKDNLPNLICSE